MPVFKNVLGLDLGAHSLKAVELRQALRGVDGQYQSTASSLGGLECE